MPALTFDDCFARLINVEKGFTNDPKDAGNWTGGRIGVGVNKGTKYGIAANTYPDLDIENLTIEQAQDIYRRDWWDALGADDLDSAIVFQLWDFAVNTGMQRAVMALQRAVGVQDDGQLGPVSEAAVNRMDKNDVLLRFNAQRLRFYTRANSWSDSGKGWVNRVAANLDYAAQDN